MIEVAHAIASEDRAGEEVLHEMVQRAGIGAHGRQEPPVKARELQVDLVFEIFDVLSARPLPGVLDARYQAAHERVHFRL